MLVLPLWVKTYSELGPLESRANASICFHTQTADRSPAPAAKLPWSGGRRARYRRYVRARPRPGAVPCPPTVGAR